VEANPLYNAKANKEARKGMQKQIEEANLLESELKEERKRAKEAKEEERKRANDAKEVERKRVKEAKEVERAEKEKAALEITKSQGKSTGVHWNKSRCKWVATFQRRGMTRRHLGCFDDRAGAVAAYSSYISSL
jgi:hypothetical protein